MSLRERDGLKVLHEVQKEHWTQRQAAVQLGPTDRWVRKLLQRLRAEDDLGIVHRLRGRRSNRRLPEALQERAVARVRESYRDFGPTLAMEYLAKRYPSADGLQFEKQRYQVARADIRGGLRGARVRIEKRLDGTLAVRFRERYLTVRVCEPAGRDRPKPEAARGSVKKISRVSSRPPSRSWMQGFRLKNNPPLWKVLKQESRPWASNPEGR